MKKITNQRFFNLLSWFLFVTALTFITTWLPFLRSLCDGESYRWGTSFYGLTFSGAGLSTDYYYLVINFAIGFFLMWSMYWTGKRIIFYTLGLLWYGFIFTNSLYQVFLGGGYEFHGDTLGIHLDLSYVIVPAVTLLLAAMIYFIIQDRGRPFNAQWVKKNRIWTLLILLPIPLQAILLRTGESHELSDQIGVIIAIVQVVVLPFALKGYKIMTPPTE